MKDWARHRRAKELRESGLTLKAVGVEIGVCGQRVRQLLAELDRYERRLAYELEHPEDVPWHQGLRHYTVWQLMLAGIVSKEDCRVLLADTLPMHGKVVTLPGWDGSRNHWHPKYVSLSVANQVRAWLGVAPYVPPPKEPRVASAAEIKRARDLLERHGYTVTEGTA